MDGPAVNQVIDDLKRLEHEGYHFEAADASLELLMRRAAGWEQSTSASRACA
jgi:2-isopropylmalate synthase